MKRRASEEFLPYFFDKAVQYHCRKGNLNLSCECEYCYEKRRFTKVLSFCFRRYRDSLRKEARQELDLLKKEILNA